MNKTEWILCPICGNKTRTMIREDTGSRFGNDRAAMQWLASSAAIPRHTYCIGHQRPKFPIAFPPIGTAAPSGAGAFQRSRT